MTDTRSGETDDVAVGTDADIHGPIDFLLLEFPSEGSTGEAADALFDLVARDVVRIYDLLVVRKGEDGLLSGAELTDATSEDVGGFAAFSGARSGLLTNDDVRAAAEAMQPGTAAAMIVYENRWAVPFVAAARDVGAQVVANVHIPATAVMEALDELETADATS